jgi:hypothetical protein
VSRDRDGKRMSYTKGGKGTMGNDQPHWQDDFPLRQVNAMLGVFVPALVTPLELLGDDDEDRG